MEARVSIVETHIDHIREDITVIRGDIKELRHDIGELRKTGLWLFIITWSGIIGCALGLAGMMAKGFGWL